MNVEIFVTTKFSGKVTNGKGAYAIALRLEGKPETAKIHVAGWRNLSYQKLNTRAVVDAIQCMVAPAHIVLYIDNLYAEHMIEKGTAKGNAHQELWNTFFEIAEHMESVKVIRDVKHLYSERLIQEINAGGYSVIEDR